MPVLLDTHAFLWWCDDARELSKKARKTISDEECLVSLASLWEISIKASQGKLKLPSSFDRYIPEQILLNGFSATSPAAPSCRGIIEIRLTGY